MLNMKLNHEVFQVDERRGVEFVRALVTVLTEQSITGT